VSELFPVSDAGLGAATYMLEILTGVVGDRRRWRTMPWMVLAFGLMIVPLGVVSIAFIIIQPILLGTWCTLCLAAAAAMLLQIPYSVDEIVACLQFLRDRRRAGRNLWTVFWRGDTMEGGRTLPEENFARPLREVLRQLVSGGINVPWNLAVSAAIGIALMFSRLLFGHEGAAANSDHLVGSLVVTFSVMAWAEPARPLRLVNIGFGAWLMIAPAFLDGYSSAGIAASFVLGVLLVLLALPAGRIQGHYGSWDRVLRYHMTLHLRLPRRQM
jgi:hypothetical protein